MRDIKYRLEGLGIDWFIPAAVITVFLAWLAPGPGINEQPVSLSEIAAYGISLIFFFYGLKLKPRELWQGLANWRMHALIQSITFIIFPLLALAVKPFFKSSEALQLWPGIFFLCALPSTVSSSVIMVSIAGGNIPAAVFNASISALTGVFITPLWIALCFQSNSGSIDTADTVLKLVFQVLIPLVIGMVLHRRFGDFAAKHKKALKNFDQLVILLIIYTSFCRSFAGKLFKGLESYELVLLAAGMLLLFFIVLCFAWLISKLLKFNRPDTITVIFCGSKKSLVHGSVMSGILFPGSYASGFILLPIMLYHALQLVASSILAKRMEGK